MINTEKLKFKKFCMTIGNLPASYVDSMSYYECLMWLCNYLQNTVIPTVNNNAEAVDELQHLYIELKDYVDNYFANLDVQEEINNKLDDMVEAGTLQEIIADYLNSKAIFGFDNVASMKVATNLIDGSYAKTLGYHSKNDGGGATYKIRTITNDDIIDEGAIVSMSDDTLVAELIFENDYVDIMQFGLVEGDDESNASFNTTIVNNAIAYCKRNIDLMNTIKFSSGIYCLNNISIDESINLIGVPSISQPQNAVIGVGKYSGGTILLDCTTSNSATAFITYHKEDHRIWGVRLKDLYIKGKYQKHAGLNLISTGWDSEISNVIVNKFFTGIIFNDCYDSFINNLTVVDCGLESGSDYSYAIILDDDINPSDNTNALHFTNCHFEVTRHCILVNKGRENCFTNCKFEFGNPSELEAQIKITSNAQDTQFIGSSFVLQPKTTNNQTYAISVESTNSLRNTQFESCEFICPSSAYKVISSVGGTIINGCSFQLLSGEDYGLYLNGRCIFTNNYVRSKDTSVSGGTTQVIYCNNSIIANNMFEHVGGGTNIANTRAITFIGTDTVISNNSNTDLYSQPYYFDGSANLQTKLDRTGVITLGEADLTRLYGTDFSQEGEIIVPLNLNDVKGAKVIRFNCSKQITITNISKAVGQDNIMIGSSNQAVLIKNSSSTAGTRILTPTSSSVNVFGTQLCDLHFVEWYWRTGYYSTIN